MGCLNHSLTHATSEKSSDSPTTATLRCETQHISVWCYIHMAASQKKKVMKHIIYVWSRPAMSMKWVRCSYHNLQHIASEKLRESPTTTLTVRPIIHQCGVTSIWLPVKKEGAETHYICMK